MVTKSLQYLQFQRWNCSPSLLGPRGGCGPRRSRPIGAEAGRQAAWGRQERRRCPGWWQAGQGVVLCLMTAARGRGEGGGWSCEGDRLAAFLEGLDSRGLFPERSRG